ncbi:MAG TPA: D-2-hydroxyacid dehydrogenase [Dongiaceae bacterium]|nr:D-2-hydroxyacid dehydrogenase [Dongiaceae bacterium]
MTDRQVNSVLVIHDQPDDFRDMLAGRFPDIAFTYVSDLDQLPARLAAVNPQVVFSVTQPHFAGRPQRVAAAHPSVEWLHIGGSGYEQFLPWPRQDLHVSHSAGVLAQYLAETVIGGILALNGRFLTYLDQQRQGLWRQHTFRSLSEQTLLIVGLGAIGGHLATFAKALGMRVLATRRRPEPHAAVDRVYAPESLPDLLPQADVVSLHVRLADDTRHLINRKTLALFKPGALLVNTSRGGVVDEPALIGALQAGHLGGAYLDVFATEPLPPESPLWTIPNVLITPHVSDSVSNWQILFADFFAENLERWRNGAELRNDLRLG